MRLRLRWRHADLRTRTRRSEGGAVDHARKLIDKGEARHYLADLLNVGRSTLYRTLGSRFAQVSKRCIGLRELSPCA